MSYVFLADLVVAVHVAWVAFVFFGLVLILLGRAAGWAWVSNRWFRGIHLAMILSVIVRALIWTNCPLTDWERELRAKAGQVDFEGSNVGYVLHRIIHPVGVPNWVFPVVYILFGLLIIGAFRLAPVDWRGRRENDPLPSRG